MIIDNLAEEEFLSSVEIERYWLHWEDFETNTGSTIDYFEDIDSARQCLKDCIKENPHVYYYLEDLEMGEDITSYDPND